MSHWMFHCDEVSQKVSQSMDAVLPFNQRMAVWMHLLMCRYCYRFRQQLMMLRRMSRAVGNGSTCAQTEDMLSHAAKERMKKKLDASS
ncbi:MAG: zf-HC2 domain-containing protein [Deltaproteobacteria bacterium]|nr:zf-HC2 domain-containing protein [Deltaproteobacteria bacterium]MBW2297592.1 zf-HC2 domain-containing protein [Deltaproteobacteria bacterium]MBW2611549.1 zf-HC2 domain-containing protein [Deltaproteobacteria bacterium]MBW2676668.1 zf-HC2 domain-containing protein [Deltaproteobacteria bacterium]